MILWVDELIGADEDSAVVKLMNDKPLLNSIYKQIRKPSKAKAKASPSTDEEVKPTK